MRQGSGLTQFHLFVLAASLFAWGAGCATSSGHKELSGEEKARLWVSSAQAFLAENDYTGAFQTLATAESEDRSLPEIYLTRSMIYYRKRDLPNALKQIKIALQYNPNSSDAKNTYGRLLIESGESDAAIAPLIEAANDTLFRESFKADTNLGIIYYRRGDYAQSEKYFNQAITNSPSGACVAYYYRGHLRLRESRFSAAIQDYELATRRFCNNFPDAHLAMGIAFQDSKQYDKARKKFLEIEQRFPNTQVAEQAVKQLRSVP
jgi:type IV pilus assembly protein PilF